MIAVVGGGISGLAVGHALAGSGLDFLVLEAADRPGGVLRSERCGGRVLEGGPQRTRLTPPLRSLIDDLGLAPQVATAADLPLLVYCDDRLRPVPTDLAGVLTTDLLAWPDRMRALLEPLTRGVRREETAAAFFIRKFGRRTYRRVIAPLFGGLYASDPEDMHARHALQSLLVSLRIEGSLLRALLRGRRSGNTANACSFEGGLQVLADAMGRRLGDRLRLESPAEAIQADGRGFVLRTLDAEVRARVVVLACPPAAASRILAPLAPDAAERIGRLRVNRLATVHLESEVELEATGYQVGLDEEMVTHGVTSQHDLFGRTGLYTAFLGGSRWPGVAELPDGEVSALAAAEFRAVTGGSARPLAVHRTSIPAWDRSWEALDDLKLPDGVEVCANWGGRPGITGRLLDAERVARKLVERFA